MGLPLIHDQEQKARLGIFCNLTMDQHFGKWKKRGLLSSLFVLGEQTFAKIVPRFKVVQIRLSMLKTIDFERFIFWNGLNAAEFVSNSRFSKNELRIIGIGFYFLSQSPDIPAYGFRVGIAFV